MMVSFTSVPSTAVAMLVAALLAVAAMAFATSLRPESATATPRSTSVDAEQPSRHRRFPPLVPALVVGVVVLLVSGWPVLAVTAATVSATWKRLLHDDSAALEQAKIDGIAKWLEDLRDTLRGSALAAEDALEQVALRPSPAVAAPLSRYLHHRRLGFRTDDALADLAADLDHPLADAAVSAIRLVTGGTAGAGRLQATVQALAVAARDEVTARERIDRTRAVYRASMKRLVLIAAVLVAYLRVAGGDLLAPYGTATGQVVLLVPLGLWAGCVLWLRALCDDDRLVAR